MDLRYRRTSPRTKAPPLDSYRLFQHCVEALVISVRDCKLVCYQIHILCACARANYNRLVGVIWRPGLHI